MNPDVIFINYCIDGIFASLIIILFFFLFGEFITEQKHKNTEEIIKEFKLLTKNNKRLIELNEEIRKRNRKGADKMEEYQVGQEVFISNRSNKFIGIVTKITPTGIVRVRSKSNEKAIYSFRNGCETGEISIWGGRNYIEPITEESKRKYEQSCYIQETFVILRKLSKLSYAQAVEIRKILEVKE